MTPGLWIFAIVAYYVIGCLFIACIREAITELRFTLPITVIAVIIWPIVLVAVLLYSITYLALGELDE